MTVAHHNTDLTLIGDIEGGHLSSRNFINAVSSPLDQILDNGFRLRVVLGIHANPNYGGHLLLER